MRPNLYPRRRPVDTPLYRVVQTSLGTLLSRDRDEWWETRVPPHAERELRRFARSITKAMTVPTPKKPPNLKTGPHCVGDTTSLNQHMMGFAREKS